MSLTITLRAKTAVGGVTLCAAVLMTGCGHKTYEQRLDESKRYFAYIEKLDSNLEGLAPGGDGITKKGSIEELRPPRGFKLVKAPPLQKDENGDPVEPDVDPQQPNYLNIKLPGLIATWEATLDVNSADGREKQKGYLYALSNAVLLGTGKDEEAADFTKNVLGLLAGALRVPQPDPTAAERETYPRAKSYTQPNSFDVYRFKADEIPGLDVPYTVEMFCQLAGEIQFCLLMVVPEATDSQANLSVRVPLMLERLKISSKRQAAPPKPGAGPGAPSTKTAPPPAF